MAMIYAAATSRAPITTRQSRSGVPAGAVSCLGRAAILGRATARCRRCGLDRRPRPSGRAGNSIRWRPYWGRFSRKLLFTFALVYVVLNVATADATDGNSLRSRYWSRSWLAHSPSARCRERPSTRPSPSAPRSGACSRGHLVALRPCGTGRGRGNSSSKRSTQPAGLGTHRPGSSPGAPRTPAARRGPEGPMAGLGGDIHRHSAHLPAARPRDHSCRCVRRSSTRKKISGNSCGELAVEPHLQILRRNRRSLCYAWDTLIDQPWKIMSIARSDWAVAGHSL